MLLKILKSNNLFSALLIPVIGVCFWMNTFQSPGNFEVNLINGKMPLYSMIYNLLKDHSSLQTVIAFFLVLTNSFLVSILGSSFLFLRERSFLPGIIYLITVSAVNHLHLFLPVHFATLFILITIYFILDTYHKPDEITYTFNASFFLSIASLFYLSSVVLLPLIWIAIFVLQKSDNWRLLIIPLLGFSTPWFFMWTFSFLNDTSTVLWHNLINEIWDFHNSYLFNPYFIFLTVVITIVSTLGGISIISVYHRMKVSLRKYFVIFFWMLGLTVGSAIGLITIGVEIIAISTIPIAYIISHFLLSGNKLFWKELITWIYVLTMISALYLYK